MWRHCIDYWLIGRDVQASQIPSGMEDQPTAIVANVGAMMQEQAAGGWRFGTEWQNLEKTPHRAKSIWLGTVWYCKTEHL
jgi:hypothetical protein